MFPRKYFAARYYAPRYFPKGVYDTGWTKSVKGGRRQRVMVGNRYLSVEYT
jgi:hypothetical protein